MVDTASENPEPVGSVRGLAIWFLAYLLAAVAGLLISSVTMSPMPLSLPAGAALAAAMILGARVWPALLAAAFL